MLSAAQCPLHHQSWTPVLDTSAVCLTCCSRHACGAAMLLLMPSTVLHVLVARALRQQLLTDSAGLTLCWCRPQSCGAVMLPWWVRPASILPLAAAAATMELHVACRRAAGAAATDTVHPRLRHCCVRAWRRMPSCMGSLPVCIGHCHAQRFVHGLDKLLLGEQRLPLDAHALQAG